MALSLPYYYGHSGEQYAFFRIPKLLLTDDRFAEVSTDAKLLYGLLLDRMELSYRNGWIDDQNRVFKYKGKELLPLSVIDAARYGDAQAVDSVLRYYEGYINKLCTRILYDPDGQPRVQVDEYMKRRLEIKLIYSIVSMS